MAQNAVVALLTEEFFGQLPLFKELIMFAAIRASILPPSDVKLQERAK
jgi:hypothetical protein